MLIFFNISDGRSRGFAFIGFNSSKEAKASVGYFDRTFLDTSRLQVELAKPRNDPTLDRPWSKYSKGSSANDAAVQAARPSARQVEQERQKLKDDMEKKKKFLMSIYGEEDPEMAKFVSAMKSKGKTKTWENDDEAFEGPAKAKQIKKKKEPKVKIDVSAVACKKAGANGKLVEQVHLKFEESSEDEAAADEYKKAFGSDAETDDELYDEIKVSSDDEEAVPEYDLPIADNKPTDATPNSTKSADTKPELTAEMIAENGRLFVRNLSYACMEDDLRALFEPFGPLTEVHMPISKETKRPKGFAYILFMIPEHALKAYAALDGIIFQGRLLHVLPSHEKPAPVIYETANGNKSAYKMQQEKEKKEQSAKDANWNSLFIRADTVLDAIAAQLGVDKAQIMDVRSSDNLATRLAVAETHLVQETKAYLESQGVHLDAFSGKPVARSTTVLLVKNLPFDTETREIRRLFAPFGSLGRVVLPPTTRAIALVEFLEASEARNAFKSLAYTKFKNAPLYLEWAPIEALKPATPEQLVDEEQEKLVTVAKTVSAEELVGATESDISTNMATLYVTNINWDTQADTLKQVFSSAGPVKSVKLATKKDPKTGQTLSLGFGFVQFDRKESMNRALDQLQGTAVDGHSLVLKKSQAHSAPAANNKSKKDTGLLDSDTGTKLIVRNVPFEATEKDLKELFKSFAQLKRVRLPKRFNGQHRGFAFAEFLSHSEAQNALQTLSNTHLYGRHLVLEWAKEDESIGAGEETGEVQHAREKAAKRAGGMAQAPPSKRTRVTLGQDDDLAVPADLDDDE